MTCGKELDGMQIRAKEDAKARAASDNRDKSTLLVQYRLKCADQGDAAVIAVGVPIVRAPLWAARSCSFCESETTCRLHPT